MKKLTPFFAHFMKKLLKLQIASKEENKFPQNFSIWQKLPMALMVFSLFSCSTLRPDRLYLHNPENKELAEKAKSNWAPSQASLWESVIKNQKLASDASLQAQKVLQQALVKSNHQLIPGNTWSKLLENSHTFEADLIAEQEKLKTKRANAVDNTTQIGKQIEELIKENATREKALEKLQDNQLRWQAELILFEKATQGFLVQQAAKANKDVIEPKSTGKIFEEILDNEKITKKDEEGNDIQVPIRKVLPKETLDMIEVLSSNNDLSGLGAILKGNSKKSMSKALQTPPGVNYQILSLGADLIKAKLDRGKAIKKRLDEEITLYSKRNKEIEKIHTRVKNAITEIGSEDFKHELNNTVLESLEKSLGKKPPRNTKNLIIKLQAYVLAEDLYTLSQDSFDIAEVALVHKYNIADSAISAREYEAFIQRGLETLVVYHSGGVTQEEINSILQAAQAVALGVIAAGVY